MKHFLPHLNCYLFLFVIFIFLSSCNRHFYIIDSPYSKNISEKIPDASSNFIFPPRKLFQAKLKLKEVKINDSIRILIPKKRSAIQEVDFVLSYIAKKGNKQYSKKGEEILRSLRKGKKKTGFIKPGSRPLIRIYNYLDDTGWYSTVNINYNQLFRDSLSEKGKRKGFNEKKFRALMDTVRVMFDDLENTGFLTNEGEPRTGFNKVSKGGTILFQFRWLNTEYIHKPYQITLTPATSYEVMNQLFDKLPLPVNLSLYRYSSQSNPNSHFFQLQPGIGLVWEYNTCHGDKDTCVYKYSGKSLLKINKRANRLDFKTFLNDFLPDTQPKSYEFNNGKELQIIYDGEGLGTNYKHVALYCPNNLAGNNPNAIPPPNLGREHHSMLFMAPDQKDLFDQRDNYYHKEEGYGRIGCNAYPVFFYMFNAQETSCTAETHYSDICNRFRVQPYDGKSKHLRRSQLNNKKLVVVKYKTSFYEVPILPGDFISIK